MIALASFLNLSSHTTNVWVTFLFTISTVPFAILACIACLVFLSLFAASFREINSCFMEAILAVTSRKANN